MPRFENVSCSHCGLDFGPGDAGFSHCDQHAQLARAPRAFREPEPGTPWWQTAKDCGAWTDRKEGDIGYVHFGSVEALRVYTLKIGNQARAAATPQWQPIATAPKDGTSVLIWESDSDVPVVAFFHNRRDRWFADTEHYDTNGDACVIDKLSQELVTHWMPLPAAPTVAVQSPA